MTSTVAIVTGAAGDIGRAIAARLGDDHDVVLLVDIDLPAAEKAARSLGPETRFAAVQCDITNKESVAGMARQAAALGIVKTLVNNAGAARAVSLHDTTQEIWRADLALNLEAAFLYPWAVALHGIGWTGWGAMMIFLVELVLGYAYAWKVGALEWE